MFKIYEIDRDTSNGKEALFGALGDMGNLACLHKDGGIIYTKNGLIVPDHYHHAEIHEVRADNPGPKLLDCGDRTGTIYCISARTGNIIWHKSGVGNWDTRIVHWTADERPMFLTLDGMYNAEDGTEFYNENGVSPGIWWEGENS